MTRITTSLAALAFVLSLAACNQNETEPTDTAPPPPAETTPEAAPETPPADTTTPPPMESQPPADPNEPAQTTPPEG